LWEAKKPDCSLLVSTPQLHSTGVMAYAKPGSLPDSVMSRGALFFASHYRYREGVNKLPLFVLTDGGTASAAELFAAMLRDNDAARLLGTSTLGSGCGHTNGGIDATLKNSGAKLELPDCARLRADGSNEVMGIVPDMLIAWRYRDSAFQKATKTAKALDAIVK
jgi:C-terminal processing protease CtpA/Prc